MLESLFPFILPIHIGIAIGLVVLVLYADKIGLSWMRGKVAVLEVGKVKALHRAISLGIVGSITTGALLFYPYKEYLITVPAFQVKMFFILVLIINGAFIGKVMFRATRQPFQNLSRKGKWALLLSGAVSFASWVIIIIAANLIGLS